VIPGAIRSSEVPARPALAPWCRVAEDDQRILVEHGGTVVTFEGRAATALLPRLLPILDGTRTVDELEQALGQPVAAAVRNALELLASNQLLVDGVPPAPSADPAIAAASFAAAVTRHTTQADAVEALAKAHVAVVGAGAAAAELLRQLELLGIGDVGGHSFDVEPEPGSFVVAVPGPDEAPRLVALNTLALERGAAWLQLLPFDGRVLVVGPLFLAGASACRECYVLRRGACSGYDDDFALLEGEAVRAAAPPPLIGFAASLAALLVLRWLTTCDPALPGRLYAVEVSSIVRLSHDHVLRVPRCPACGTPDRAVASPWFEAR
jgi:bacteriocin biosynthesis cyclodehydratase domain-containing protein